MKKSIGIVETRGLAISIYLADAMLKNTSIAIVRQETIDLALVTLTIEGDSSTIQQAISIAVKMAKQENQWLATTIILNPDNEIQELIKEVAKKPN